jgi:outer membrane protein OmpA-like peptidoglycan-associated protein
MLGPRIVLNKKSKDEAEKPFWISFADLMTALMMLFLVVMAVALLSVTKTVNEAEEKKAKRDREIERLLDKVDLASKRYEGVTVDRDRNVINFGSRAQFDTGSHQLDSVKEQALRAFVPEILSIARDDLGKRWLKRIVVEGYADQRGTYLMNLNLSLQRSQRVLCVLLATPFPGEKPMSPDEQEQIRELFLVGGYSFNSAKASFDESRRIELRLEFLGVDEKRPTTEGIARGNFGLCALR